MTNTNIQGPVPIDGAGMVVRKKGDYRSGEYKWLVNAEVDNGRIMRRRFMRTTLGPTNWSWSLSGSAMYRSVGIIQDALYIYKPDSGFQYIIYPSSPTGLLWTWTSIPAFSVPLGWATGNISLLSVFNYADKNYWLFGTQFSGTTPFLSFRLFSFPETDNASDLTDADTNDMAQSYSEVVTFNVNSPLTSANKLYRTSFIFKDRLWVVFNDSIYFSKATDPTVFTVPDGGFFNFPDDIVNWACAIKDTVYVFTQSKVIAITYNLDPNSISDVSVRTISDQIGGDHAVVFRDTPYFTNSEGLFAVSNQAFVEKIKEADDWGGEPHYTMELGVFGNYLTLFKIEKSYPVQDVDFKLNKFRDGLVSGSLDLTDYTPTNCVLSLPTPITQPVTGLGVTHVLRATVSGTPSQILWEAKESVGGQYFMEVTPGEVYLFGAYIQTNCTTSSTIGFQIAEYDSAGVLLMTLDTATYGGSDSLINSDGWKWVAFPMKIRGTTTARISVKMYATRSSGTYTASDYFDTQCRTARLYEGSSAFYNFWPVGGYKYAVNANTMGSQMAYFKSHYAEPVWENRSFSVGNSNSLNVQTFLLNMDNGSMHGIVPAGMHVEGDTYKYISGIITQIKNPATKSPVLFFLISDTSQVEFYDTGRATVQFMAFDREHGSLCDEYLAVGNEYQIPDVLIEWEGFSPDGPAYNMKRFRSIEINGIFPTDNMAISFATDFSNYSPHIFISDEPLGDADVYPNGTPLPVDRPHYPRRIGINARGRKISIRIKTTSLIAYNSPTPGEGGTPIQLWGEFEISDMRLLYSLTQRTPSYKQLNLGGLP